MRRITAPSYIKRIKERNQTHTTLSTGRVSKKIRYGDQCQLDDDDDDIIVIDSDDENVKSVKKPVEMRAHKKNDTVVDAGLKTLHEEILKLTDLSINNSKEHEMHIRRILIQPFRLPLGPGAECHSQAFRDLKNKRRERVSLHSPDAPNALVLYTPPEYTAEFKREHKDEVLVHVVVDPHLCRVLRPHQREGVDFMYQCLTGRQIEDYYGCILADDMGLGKTLQCITLLWTLLKQSPNMCPEITNVVIICPSSLVKNWYHEINKWLTLRLNALSIDSGQSSVDVDEKLQQFSRQQTNGTRRSVNPVLIVSYETFRGHAHILDQLEVGLMICDEGHRLKNMESQTYVCLKKVNCKRRIIISGTPIQNDLTEYYSLIDFVNPGLLGEPSKFRREFENPIAKGRDADASEKQVALGREANDKLSAIVKKCVIRRTALLLSKYLPLKYEIIVCCKLEPVQKALYKYFIESKQVQKTLQADSKGSGKKGNGQHTLQAITFLKKLCNHPSLVYDMCTKGEEGFEGLENLFPDGFSRSLRSFEPTLSGKIRLLDTILADIKNTSDDRVVLISNYTQTLDLFIRLCEMRGYKWVRLDGSLSTKKRDHVVQKFNDPTTNEFIFMLSSKAGGCGLNLIGANRLIMFDPDWNPANDGQAMARVWRDGQRKVCYLYRFLCTGSIEEKIFQRQSHKKALSNCIVDYAEDVERHFSVADLKELFRLEDDSVLSDTHEKFNCSRCENNRQIREPSKESDCASDLSDWWHCYRPSEIPDEALAKSWKLENNVSFAFYQKQVPNPDKT